MSDGLQAQPDNADMAGGEGRKYYGKYRGVVLDNADPMLMGRILAIVPDVSSLLPTTWCMPCVPGAGLQAGMLVVPSIGAGAWIEFEQGDPDYPIWTGGFWGLVADVPAMALVPAPVPPGQTIVLQTTGQNMLALSDAPPSPTSGGIILKAAGGAMIVVNDAGVFISNGQGATITLIGPNVSVNSGALTVVGATVAIDGAPLTPGA